MQYLGGKSKIAKRLAAAIGTGDVCYEPFCGGGAMTVALAENFNRVEASDLNADVILLWRALKDGWKPPDTLTEEEYAALKNAPPSALRSFAGFGCSFGGKWFGGYAGYQNKNYAAISRRTLLKQRAGLGNVQFQIRGYADLCPSPGDTVYADPPYAGTTGYRRDLVFNPGEFWDTVARWSDAGVNVFVSEYKAPESWSCVWERESGRMLRKNTGETATEKLFTRF